MTTKTTVTLPAGNYAIADPCNLLTDSEWMEWELLSLVSPGQQSFLMSDGSRLVVLHTERGDGCYFDQDDFVYTVDSGHIAIRSLSGVCTDLQDRLDHEDREWERDDQPMGRILGWSQPFDVAEEGGRLLFGDLVIPTEWDRL
jgi:hypothetical protein